MSDRYAKSTGSTVLHSQVLGLIESEEPLLVLFERTQVQLPSDPRISLSGDSTRRGSNEAILADLPQLERELWEEFWSFKSRLAARQA